jgi:hypothetical protein
MPAGVPAMVALANVTLGSTASSITFSSISGSYRDLFCVFTSPAQGNQVRPLIRLNNDSSSANYFEIVAVGNGSSASSLTYSNSGFDPSNRFSSYNDPFTVVFNVMDYSVTNKHKTALFRIDGSTQATIMDAGRWANTSAVTSVTFQIAGASPFPVGTSVALYGVSSS